VKRREFITLLGSAAAAWPLAARAQQAGKLPTIGFMGATTPSAGGHPIGVYRRAGKGKDGPKAARRSEAGPRLRTIAGERRQPKRGPQR